MKNLTHTLAVNNVINWIWPKLSIEYFVLPYAVLKLYTYWFLTVFVIENWAPEITINYYNVNISISMKSIGITYKTSFSTFECEILLYHWPLTQIISRDLVDGGWMIMNGHYFPFVFYSSTNALFLRFRVIALIHVVSKTTLTRISRSN